VRALQPRHRTGESGFRVHLPQLHGIESAGAQFVKFTNLAALGRAWTAELAETKRKVRGENHGGEKIWIGCGILASEGSLVDFSPFNGGGKVQEVVFRDVLDLKDQGGECGFQFVKGDILFQASRGRNDSAEFFYAFF